jgi:hypothetical protein
LKRTASWAIEPVAEFLSTARAKSGINLVLDTVYLQG